MRRLPLAPYVLAVAACVLVTAPSSGMPTEFQPNYDQGYEAGYSFGYESGFATGKQRGTTEGTEAGKLAGFDAGWDAAYQPAYDRAYDAAWPSGHEEGWNHGAIRGFQAGYASWVPPAHSTLRLSTMGEFSQYIGPGIVLDFSNQGFINYLDPGMSWGSILSAGTLTVNTSLSFGSFEYDWAAHYYRDGYANGKTTGLAEGDTAGYDFAYPLAYAAAYDLAFLDGQEQGTIEGTHAGKELGYSAGWAVGSQTGYDEAFPLGLQYRIALEYGLIPYYVGEIGSNFPLAAVPEPASLALIGVTWAFMPISRRRRR